MANTKTAISLARLEKFGIRYFNTVADMIAERSQAAQSKGQMFYVIDQDKLYRKLSDINTSTIADYEFIGDVGIHSYDSEGQVLHAGPWYNTTENTMMVSLDTNKDGNLDKHIRLYSHLGLFDSEDDSELVKFMSDSDAVSTMMFFDVADETPKIWNPLAQAFQVVGASMFGTFTGLTPRYIDSTLAPSNKNAVYYANGAITGVTNGWLAHGNTAYVIEKDVQIYQYDISSLVAPYEWTAPDGVIVKRGTTSKAINLYVNNMLHSFPKLYSVDLSTPTLGLDSVDSDFKTLDKMIDLINATNTLVGADITSIDTGYIAADSDIRFDLATLDSEAHNNTMVALTVFTDPDTDRMTAAAADSDVTNFDVMIGLVSDNFAALSTVTRDLDAHDREMDSDLNNGKVVRIYNEFTGGNNVGSQRMNLVTIIGGFNDAGTSTASGWVLYRNVVRVYNNGTLLATAPGTTTTTEIVDANGVTYTRGDVQNSKITVYEDTTLKSTTTSKYLFTYKTEELHKSTDVHTKISERTKVENANFDLITAELNVLNNELVVAGASAAPIAYVTNIGTFGSDNANDEIRLRRDSDGDLHFVSSNASGWFFNNGVYYILNGGKLVASTVAFFGEETLTIDGKLYTRLDKTANGMDVYIDDQQTFSNVARYNYSTKTNVLTVTDSEYVGLTTLATIMSDDFKVIASEIDEAHAWIRAYEPPTNDAFGVLDSELLADSEKIQIIDKAYDAYRWRLNDSDVNGWTTVGTGSMISFSTPATPDFPNQIAIADSDYFGSSSMGDIVSKNFKHVKDGINSALVWIHDNAGLPSILAKDSDATDDRQIIDKATNTYKWRDSEGTPFAAVGHSGIATTVVPSTTPYASHDKSYYTHGRTYPLVVNNIPTDNFEATDSQSIYYIGEELNKIKYYMAERDDSSAGGAKIVADVTEPDLTDKQIIDMSDNTYKYRELAGEVWKKLDVGTPILANEAAVGSTTNQFIDQSVNKYKWRDSDSSVWTDPMGPAAIVAKEADASFDERQIIDKSNMHYRFRQTANAPWLDLYQDPQSVETRVTMGPVFNEVTTVTPGGVPVEVTTNVAASGTNFTVNTDLAIAATGSDITGRLVRDLVGTIMINGRVIASTPANGNNPMADITGPNGEVYVTNPNTTPIDVSMTLPGGTVMPFADVVFGYSVTTTTTAPGITTVTRTPTGKTGMVLIDSDYVNDSDSIIKLNETFEHLFARNKGSVYLEDSDSLDSDTYRPVLQTVIASSNTYAYRDSEAAEFETLSRQYLDSEAGNASYIYPMDKTTTNPKVTLPSGLFDSDANIKVKLSNILHNGVKLNNIDVDSSDYTKTYDVVTGRWTVSVTGTFKKGVDMEFVNAAKVGEGKKREFVEVNSSIVQKHNPTANVIVGVDLTNTGAPFTGNTATINGVIKAVDLNAAAVAIGLPNPNLTSNYVFKNTTQPSALLPNHGITTGTTAPISVITDASNYTMTIDNKSSFLLQYGAGNFSHTIPAGATNIRYLLVGGGGGGGNSNGARSGGGGSGGEGGAWLTGTDMTAWAGRTLTISVAAAVGAGNIGNQSSVSFNTPAGATALATLTCLGGRNGNAPTSTGTSSRGIFTDARTNGGAGERGGGGGGGQYNSANSTVGAGGNGSAGVFIVRYDVNVNNTTPRPLYKATTYAVAPTGTVPFVNPLMLDDEVWSEETYDEFRDLARFVFAKYGFA